MEARLKSGIWVAAFLRRMQVEGRFGAVLQSGDQDAGAVYVVINQLDGTHHLWGPPPGPAYSDEGDRRFERLTQTPMDWAEISTRIAGLRKFDSDIWVVEIEDRTGTVDTLLNKS
jgi:hypothetical protein